MTLEACVFDSMMFEILVSTKYCRCIFGAKYQRRVTLKASSHVVLISPVNNNNIKKKKRNVLRITNRRKKKCDLFSVNLISIV